MNIKKIVMIGMLVSMFLGNSFSNAVDYTGEWLGEKPDWSPDVSVSTTFLTKYIWRGQNLGDEPVFQMDTAFSKYGITLDFWTNYSLNNDKAVDGGRYQEYTEADYTIDYTFNVGEMSETYDLGMPDALSPLSISGGYIYYTFPNTDWDDDGFDSHEIYLGVSYDSFFEPFFTWYCDVDSGSGSYFQTGIGHSFNFENGITSAVGMTVGYNHEQWTDNSGFSDMVLSGEVSIPAFNYFTVTPNVAYSIILDDDTYDGAQENEFYGGITIGFAY